MLDQAWRGSMAYPGYWLLLLVLFVVAVALNARRVVRGLTEVLDARRRRLLLERGRIARSLDHPDDPAVDPHALSDA